MADNNERWSRHVAPFELPAPSQKPAATQEPDRSWMPTPTTGASGIDWHKDGKWRAVWKQPCDWAQQHNPAFSAKLSALEATLATVEKTEGAYSPRLKPARDAVSRCYVELNQLHDAWIKTQPFVRY